MGKHAPSNGKALRRQAFLQTGFELYSARNIDAVSMEDVARASGHGVATLYRYFGSKSHFLVEIATWKWSEFFQENRKLREGLPSNPTARDLLDFYLDSFLRLYQSHRDLLRFNQFLNIYIRSGDFEGEALDGYQTLMEPIFTHFHDMYQLASKDHTIRTDVPPQEMLSVTLHLMLAVVTRYAVGLAWEPEGFDAEKEIRVQIDMLTAKYAGERQ